MSAKPVISSVFKAAAWFDKRAGRKLSPIKLHALLFLAWGLYAAENSGRALFPAVFAADSGKVYEPNLYAAADAGFSAVAADVPREAEAFLASVWDRYGGLSAERLVATLRQTEPVRDALRRGEGSLINAAVSETKAPSEDKGITLRSVTTGEAVKAHKWIPGGKK